MLYNLTGLLFVLQKFEIVGIVFVWRGFLLLSEFILEGRNSYPSFVPLFIIINTLLIFRF